MKVLLNKPNYNNSLKLVNEYLMAIKSSVVIGVIGFLYGLKGRSFSDWWEDVQIWIDNKNT